MLFAGHSAWAVDAIVLEARQMTVAGIPVENASVRLDVLSDKQTRLSVHAGAVTLADPVGRLTAVTLTCDSPVVAEPRFGCESGNLAAAAARPARST